jgi:hypothetical protein
MRRAAFHIQPTPAWSNVMAVSPDLITHRHKPSRQVRDPRLMEYRKGRFLHHHGFSVPLALYERVLEDQVSLSQWLDPLNADAEYLALGVLLMDSRAWFADLFGQAYLRPDWLDAILRDECEVP